MMEEDTDSGPELVLHKSTNKAAVTPTKPPIPVETTALSNSTTSIELVDGATPTPSATITSASDSMKHGTASSATATKAVPTEAPSTLQQAPTMDRTTTETGTNNRSNTTQNQQ